MRSLDVDNSGKQLARGITTTQPTVSVVIPALNEEDSLPHVLAQLPRCLHEVILVDGCSVDSTVKAAQSVLPSIRVVKQNRKGKGNALACGFAACRGDIVVTLDADGSTDPAEIPRFVQALSQGADFAKGSRFISGGCSNDVTHLRRAGNDLLVGVVNLLFGTRYSDLCYGYNAFWARHIPVFRLHSTTAPGRGEQLWGDGFEIEALMHVRFALSGLVVTEVASQERRRLYGRSHLKTMNDGMRVLRTILRERRKAGPAQPALYPQKLDGVATPTTNGT